MHDLENEIAVNLQVPTARISDGVEIAPLQFPVPSFIISFLLTRSKPCPQACVFRLWSIAVSPLQFTRHRAAGQTQLRSLVPLRGSTFFFWLRRNSSLSASSVVHCPPLPSLSSFSFVIYQKWFLWTSTLPCSVLAFQITRFRNNNQFWKKIL